MVKIHINFTNKWLYTLALIIGIFALGVGVYAAVGTTPNPGHPITELQPCDTAGEILKSDGTTWTCGTEGGGSLWTLDGSDIYYDAGNIRLNGTTIWFQTNGARTSLCYDGASCAISEEICTEDNEVPIYLAEGETCSADVNNAWCNKNCIETPPSDCFGADLTGCIGSTFASYTFGNLKSCTQGGTFPFATCRCSVSGQKYFSEYLQNPTCIG